MTALVALPTIVVRLLAEIAIAIVAFSIVRPRDRRAGLALGIVAAVAAVGDVLVPLAQIAGIATMVWASPTTSNGTPYGWMFALFFLLELFPPLGHAALFATSAVTLARLARRLPLEERDVDTWTR